MATRVAFSKEDQSHVVDWLVKYHPQKENRRGNVVWKQLTQDKNAHPWNGRHSWQSWRENYIDNMVHYDILISKKYRAIHGSNANPNNATTSAVPTSNSFPPKRPGNKPSQSKQNGAKPSTSARLAIPTSPHRPLSPQSNSNSPSPSQVPRDIKSLAQYFFNNHIEERIRGRPDIFQGLKRTESTSAWSRSRSSLEWRAFYTAHKEEIDDLVREGGLGIASLPMNGNALPNMKKRRREEEGHASAVDTLTEPTRRPPQEGPNGVKKRRLNGTDAPSSHLEPSNVIRPPTPLTDGQTPPDPTTITTTSPNKRTPVVLVPETPPRSHSSRAVTPIALSKADLTGTSAFILKTVASALKNAYSSSGMGPYGIQGSPIGSIASRPPSPEEAMEEPSMRAVEPSRLSMANGVLRINGKVPAMHGFPHSLPSLAPGFGDTIPVLARGVEADETTPDAGNAQRKSIAYPSLKGSSIFTQVGQETPRGDPSGNSRQEIFPHTLPHLAPTLRPGPNGENQYILNDDGIVFTSQHDNEDHLAHLSPDLQIGHHEETGGTIQDRSIQFLERSNRDSAQVTPQSILDDDDEFEGPSPMPYLGSDRHSSRSYSFSHGQDDSLPGPLLEGLAKALSNQLLREDGHDSQEVDELANDVDEEGEGEGEGVNERSGPRYVVSTKRPRRPSESPLFASSSASDNEGRAGELKAVKVGLHYPVKAKVKAKGIVRVRGRRSSDRGMEIDEDSESDPHEAMGDSDKENAAMAEFNDILQNESPPAVGEDPIAPKSIAQHPPVALQDEMDQTPDFHSSPKSLHFSGKTPTSPNVTATTIKPQAGLNLAPPATAPASSKDPISMRKHHGKGFPTFDADDRSKETLLKAALSYPSPNIPSELEEALQRKEEPSPLQRLAEKAILGKGAKDDGHVSDAGKARHGKVRFDGVALDRDRRKTTGGIGFEFGAGGVSRGIVSDVVAGPSHSRFKAAPALFGSQRRPSGPAGIGSQNIHLERKSVQVIELEDGDEDEDEDESPLARYSAASRVATSPHKTQQGHAKSDRTMRSSSLGPTSTRPPPPPKPIPVPVIAAGGSLAGNSPLARSTGRKGDLSAREFGTATWSPIRFGPASGSQAANHGAAETLVPSSSQKSNSEIPPSSSLKPGFDVDAEQGLSIGFRDQDRDAEWVDTVYGRPSITSKKIDPRRRSAPIPSDGDVIVYISPSRERSRDGKRSTVDGGRDTSGVESLSIISDADKQRILTWLAENRNPDHSPGSDSDDESDEAAKIFEGLALMFESMAANNGFVASVPRNVWKQCMDLSETAVVVQAMTDAANATGLEVLEARQRIIAQQALETREAVLSKEVDGRRKSGRYSAGGVGVGIDPPVPSGNIASSSSRRDSDGGYERNGRSSRLSRSKSRDGRRPRPPSYVPAEVVEPILSRHS